MPFDHLHRSAHPRHLRSAPICSVPFRPAQVVHASAHAHHLCSVPLQNVPPSSPPPSAHVIIAAALCRPPSPSTDLYRPLPLHRVDDIQSVMQDICRTVVRHPFRKTPFDHEQLLCINSATLDGILLVGVEEVNILTHLLSQVVNNKSIPIIKNYT